MPKITINHQRCKGCLLCVDFCPKGLIGKSEGLNKQGVKYAQFKADKKCLGCAFCALICPDCCIEVWK
jgi:2-oxoglutarate ferredoxin oxidoreductase subunit delta